MGITLDDREKSPLLAEKFDGVKRLRYGEGGHSFDILIERKFEPYRIGMERKTWNDAVSSWQSKKLDRQIAPDEVNALLVEMPSSMERAMWDSDFRESSLRTLKHLARVSFTMPVIPSWGEESTAAICRYLEEQSDLSLRVKKNIKRDDTFYAGLAKLLGLSPTRILANGQTILEAIRPLVDTEALAAALGIRKWHTLGIGIGTGAEEAAIRRLKAPS